MEIEAIFNLIPREEITERDFNLTSGNISQFSCMYTMLSFSKQSVYIFDLSLRVTFSGH